MARTKDFDENDVLDRAMKIFWSRGYNATSMEDLVSGLGISRSSLYGTYSDKHSLFLKALENYQQMGFGRIHEIASQQGSAKEIVRKLIELATAGPMIGKERNGCFMLNASVEVAPHDKQVSKLVCRNDQQMEEVFYQVIKNGKVSGEIKNPKDARALSKFIFNTVKGLQVTLRSTTDKSVYEDVVNIALSALN